MLNIINHFILCSWGGMMVFVFVFIISVSFISIPNVALLSF